MEYGAIGLWEGAKGHLDIWNLRFTSQFQCSQFHPDLAHDSPGSVSLRNVTVGLFFLILFPTG